MSILFRFLEDIVVLDNDLPEAHQPEGFIRLIMKDPQRPAYPACLSLMLLCTR